MRTGPLRPKVERKFYFRRSARRIGRNRLLISPSARLLLALRLLGLLGGLGGGLGLGLEDLGDDLLLLDQEGPGDSALEGVGGDAATVGPGDGLGPAGDAARSELGGAGGLDPLEGLAGVTALGHGSA